MGRIKNALYRFMYGRYGNDTLNNTLLWTYVGLVVFQMIVPLFIERSSFAYTLVSLLFMLLSWALIGVIFFRMLSRNIAKRRRENERFTGFFKLRRNKWRDRKTHVYRKCPSCRATLRLPKARGKHAVVCPKCRNRFEVKG